MEELADDQIDPLVQDLIELLDVAFGFQTDAGEVDGGEAQVPSAAGDLFGPVMDVAHDPGAAAHVGDFGVVIAGLIILEVEGGI